MYGVKFIYILKFFTLQVFTLPSMKPFCKNKITMTEGYHISKVGFSTFPNKAGKIEFLIRVLYNALTFV